ncbi:RagB/SusD family nutrient uptake outer membrane protein [Pseudoflavitalea sp. X16]|uniref:RagB/SusD family nutrient uptake outer membrane protein n=1 Tax=Paraflavitalea devenefica TaxID=2716334 RepID=UPI00141EAEDA|nr:RagB/SusD family nutrient uptake outer membrane protein [Paraflavitalea devenefica]NII24858.1 RagB/SusD family nutrient uptake outer membrane protein [Paraflavitalea devenefica]
MNKKINILPIIITCLFSITGCTKLNEQILDESSVANMTQKQIAESLIAPVYAKLPDIFLHTNYFALQEIPTDEAILPYRGGTDWYDGGIYITSHKHEFLTSDKNINATWILLFQSISRSISAINQLPEVNDPSAKTFIAEARAMRAYYSMLSLDLFGLIFTKDDAGQLSKILRGSEAIEYIKGEFLAAEADLPTINETHGRMSKAAVWGMLARLHLNAAVYKDIYSPNFNFASEDMDKVIEYCDKIIGTNNYQFSPEYFALFDDNNNTNKEIVFAVDQRSDLNGHNRMAYFSLSGDQFPLPDYVGANGTDGPAITPDFYRSWADFYAPNDPKIDPRFYKENLSRYSDPANNCVPAAQFYINRGILRGQQYGLKKKDGVFLKCPNGDMLVDSLFHASRSKPTLPVYFTEKVDFTLEGSNYPSGYRVSKYMFSRKSVSGRNFGEANIVILRLADIYMMRAEAKLRKSNDANAALADVNTVRASRTARQAPPALTSIDLNALFRERGFEFYWECLRRTDMIRFGKYEGTWTEKTNTNPKKRIFPIPQAAMDGASSLKDYLKQNDSY